MSLSHSPSMVVDNMILYLDPCNTKSYTGSGTTVTDLSGFLNNGTLNGGVGFNLVNNFGTFTFDGVNDYISIPASSAFDLGTGDFSCSVWIKTNVFNLDGGLFRRIFMLGSDGNRAGNFQIILDTATGNAYMWSNTSQLATIGTINVSNNIWHNIVVTRTGNTFRLYVDSIHDGTQVFTTAMTNNGFSTLIGRYVGATQGRFNGSMSSIILQKYALTPEQVKNNFNMMRHRFGV